MPSRKPQKPITLAPKKRTEMPALVIARIGVLRSQGLSGYEIGKRIHSRFGFHASPVREIVSRYYRDVHQTGDWRSGLTAWKLARVEHSEKKAAVLRANLARETQEQRDQRWANARKASKAFPKSERSRTSRANALKVDWSTVAQAREKNMTARAKSARGRNAMLAYRRNRLRRLGVLYVERVPIVDKIKLAERNALLTARFPLIEQIVIDFRGPIRHDRDLRLGIHPEIVSVARESALLAIRKCFNRKKLNVLIRDQIKHDLFLHLAAEKSHRMRQRFSRPVQE